MFIAFMKLSMHVIHNMKVDVQLCIVQDSVLIF